MAFQWLWTKGLMVKDHFPSGAVIFLIGLCSSALRGIFSCSGPSVQVNHRNHSLASFLFLVWTPSAQQRVLKQQHLHLFLYWPRGNWSPQEKMTALELLEKRDLMFWDRRQSREPESCPQLGASLTSTCQNQSCLS